MIIVPTRKLPYMVLGIFKLRCVRPEMKYIISTTRIAITGINSISALTRTLLIAMMVSAGKQIFRTNLRSTGASSLLSIFRCLAARPTKKDRMRGIIFSTKGFMDALFT